VVSISVMRRETSTRGRSEDKIGGMVRGQNQGAEDWQTTSCENSGADAESAQLSSRRLKLVTTLCLRFQVCNATFQRKRGKNSYHGRVEIRRVQVFRAGSKKPR